MLFIGAQSDRRSCESKHGFAVVNIVAHEEFFLPQAGLFNSNLLIAVNRPGTKSASPPAISAGVIAITIHIYSLLRRLGLASLLKPRTIPDVAQPR